MNKQPFGDWGFRGGERGQGTYTWRCSTMNQQPFRLGTGGDCLGVGSRDRGLIHGDVLQWTNNPLGWELGGTGVLGVGTGHRALGAQASRISGHKRRRNRCLQLQMLGTLLTLAIWELLDIVGTATKKSVLWKWCRAFLQKELGVLPCVM